MKRLAPMRLQVMPNLTPLVDISLLLVVVFLAVAPLLARPLPLKLPPVEVKRSERLVADQVVLRADPAGMTVNGAPVTDDRLLDTLKTALAGGDVVFLDAHPDLPYERVVALLEVIRRAGAGSVGLTPDLAAANGVPADGTAGAGQPVAPGAAPAAGTAPAGAANTMNSAANPTEVAQ